MKRDEILVRLRNWCNMITKKYEWLTVKFEYNDKRETYLVSFYPCSKIDTCDQFNIDAMAFEDEMNDLYGNMAPLFCDEESCFKLSAAVEIFGANIHNFETELSENLFSWNLGYSYIMSETNMLEECYSLAA